MLIADTHVHVYPAHDTRALFISAWQNLKQFARGNQNFHAGLFLTERAGDFYFRNLAAGKLPPPQGFRTAPCSETGVLIVEQPDQEIRFWVFAGRQIVPKEKIEVHCLAADADIPDGLSAAETVSAIRNAGGIPVIPWSPGKWLFKRGKTVRDLIDNRNGRPLIMGDTSMRPCGFPRPSLLRHALRNGIPVIAGSDPLPFAGDEAVAGKYFIAATAFDPAMPLTSARALINNGNFISGGRRDSPVTALYRWLKNRNAGA
ncbi:MAG TPA: hypothetical protein PJ991_11165 [Kiritimatiellia bacterium]|nr:hypothetical protein [Kiritimatiellia bacterium]